MFLRITLLAKLKREHPQIETLVVDLCNWQSVNDTISTILPIDLLVNNAGFGSAEPLNAITEEKFDRYFFLKKLLIDRA